jgi:hypothetical protein
VTALERERCRIRRSTYVELTVLAVAARVSGFSGDLLGGSLVAASLVDGHLDVFVVECHDESMNEVLY